MPFIKLDSVQDRFRFILFSVLGCALLIDAASAEDVQIITRAGQKQMLS